MRFVVFIKDPYIKTPYVGIAPVQVQADDEGGARSAALDAYNRAATGSFADGDIGLVTALAEDFEDVPLATGLLDATEPAGVESVEESEEISGGRAGHRCGGSMRVNSVKPQAPYSLIHKSS